MVREDGLAIYADYADYMANHQRKPGIGPWQDGAGKDGSKVGRGEPNPDQVDAYIANGGFFKKHIPMEAQFFKHANVAWQDFAVGMACRMAVSKSPSSLS
ncbi:MAG: hypothetical protein R3D29_15820 [Nitratireductor sp.]